MDDTLGDVIARLSARGDAPAIIAVDDNGECRTWSYARLARESLAFARGVVADGLVPGTPVAILSPNRPEWIVARLGLLAAGALAVPLDDLITDEALERALGDSGARLVLTTSAYIGRFAALSCAGELRLLCLDREADDGAAASWRSVGRAGAASAALPPHAPDQVVSLFYTSGTTGPPKGVPLTRRNLAVNLRALVEGGYLAARDRVLLPLPLHHSYPFLVGMLLPLAVGAAIVLPPGIAGPEIVLGLRAGRATAMVGVPRLYDAILAGVRARAAGRGALAARLFDGCLAVSIAAARHLGWHWGRVLFGALHRRVGLGLRVLACGGARLEPETEWALVGLGWRVLTGYGLVETSSISTFNPLRRARVGSAGLPGPGVELRIADADGEGRGEIWLRGPHVFSGYRDNDEANRAAFAPGGWFRTGDRGRIDADGYLHVVGRLKELIVLADGKNVTPDIVEPVYAANPFIREFALLERKGDLVALVVPNLDAIRGAGSGNIEQVIRVALIQASQSLPSFQRLSGYAIVREALPKTRLGKFKRHELASIYEAALRAGGRARAAGTRFEDGEFAQSPRAQALWLWLGERFPDADISPDTAPQLDLGIDSLGWIELGMEIERRFGISLSAEAVSRIATLGDLLGEAAAAHVPAHAAVVAAPVVAASVVVAPAVVAPAVAVEDPWLGRRGMALRATGLLLYLINAFVLRGFFRLKVEGLEHVPPTGAVLIAPNHRSDIDGFVVAAALGYRRMTRTWFGGDAVRLFSNPLRRHLARAARVFPVDDRAAGQAIRLGREVLARRMQLVWFAEGWRSPDGAVQRFLPGVAEVLRGARAAVIPVRIFGTFEALPRDRRLPRLVRLRVVFGAPISGDALLAGADGAAAAERLRAAVVALD